MNKERLKELRGNLEFAIQAVPKSQEKSQAKFILYLKILDALLEEPRKKRRKK